MIRIDIPAKRAAVTELVGKSPGLSNRMLARILFDKYPEWFKDVEAARDCVRRRRGAHGDKDRKDYKHYSYMFQNRTGFKWEMPKSIAESWEPYHLDDGEVLVLSDIHIPYHDDGAVAASLDYGKTMRGGKGPSAILLNGDAADFFSQSRFEKDPRQRSLVGEIKAIRSFLGYVRQSFPKSKIIYKLGNHDERWEKWQWEKAPEYLDIPQMTMESILTSEIERTEKFDHQPKIDGILWVKDQRPIMAGALAILHGHEFPRGMSSPVNPARGNFMRGMESSLAGHLHRTSEHVETTMHRKMISCWSTGCLCGLYPNYSKMNKWNHGFATISLHKNEYQVNNLRIIKGRVYG